MLRVRPASARLSAHGMNSPPAAAQTACRVPAEPPQSAHAGYRPLRHASSGKHPHLPGGSRGKGS